MNPDQHEKELIEHYDKLAPEYTDLYEGPSRLAHFYNIRRTRIFELLDDLAERQLLEVGCGAGMLVDRFLERNVKYHGVDISPGMIDVCRERFRDAESLRFSVGKSQRLDFPDGTFDVVVSIGMVEYVSDQRIAIAEMARVLKPGGVLVISGINKWSPYNAWNRLVYRRVTKWSPVNAWNRLVHGTVRRTKPRSIIHEYHAESQYREFLADADLAVKEIIYFDFNFFLAPFDRRLARIAHAATKKLERFCRSPLRKTGNGFLVKCVKSL